MRWLENQEREEGMFLFEIKTIVEASYHRSRLHAAAIVCTTNSLCVICPTQVKTVIQLVICEVITLFHHLCCNQYVLFHEF